MRNLPQRFREPDPGDAPRFRVRQGARQAGESRQNRCRLRHLPPRKLLPGLPHRRPVAEFRRHPRPDDRSRRANGAQGFARRPSPPGGPRPELPVHPLDRRPLAHHRLLVRATTADRSAPTATRTAGSSPRGRSNRSRTSRRASSTPARVPAEAATRRWGGATSNRAFPATKLKAKTRPARSAIRAGNGSIATHS